MKRLLLLVLVVVACAGVGVMRAQSPRPVRSGKPDVLQSYGKLPLSFEANVGQVDPKVAFLSRSAARSLFLSSTEAVLTLRQPDEPSVVRMKLVGANRDAKASAQDELPGKINYFIGNDPMKWHTNVPTHAKVRYEGVYPGIDLVYYGNEGRLEYDFIVSPGANPEAIALSFDGVGSMTVDGRGDLVLNNAGSELRWKRPVVYQQADGVRKEISARYVQSPGNRISFDVGPYDAQSALVIDPVLQYSTYVGGGGTSGNAIAVDAAGSAYITGGTGFFPTQNAVQAGHGGGFTDAFVTKLSVDGSALVYSTYIGGNSEDSAAGIAVDASGNAYLTGSTSSTNFPTVSAWQPARNADPAGDAFITKLSASGSTIVYSTYLGASGTDNGKGIAVDASGNAYIVGTTSGPNPASDFPVVNAFQSCGGNNQAFAGKLNPLGSAFLYLTCIGGGSSNGNGIAVDSAGSAYIVGQTSAPGFSATSDFPHVTGVRGGDAFVVKLNAAGSARVYAARIGHGTEGLAIAVDGSGNAIITGKTSTPQPAWEYFFPTVNALQPDYGGGAHDAFVTKLNAGGTALVYSTYLGGNDWDTGMAIAVDPGGNAYISGSTASTDFLTLAAVQSFNAGALDAFVTKLTPAGSAIYSTYLGGAGLELDWTGGIAADASGNAYVTGSTESHDFPTIGAYQTTSPGMFNAFVAKIEQGAPPAPTPPTITDIADRTVGVNGNTGQVAFTVGDTGTPPGSLVVTRSSSNQTLVPDANIVFGGAGANRTLTLTPAAGLTGSATVTVTVTDGDLQTASDSFLVTVINCGGCTPVVQSQGAALGTWSIGQVEIPLSATGGSGTAYTWSVFGSLPPGISIRTDLPSCCFPGTASAGLIGIATMPGLYTFTLRATSAGVDNDRTYTLKITALTGKENQLPDAFVGAADSYQLSPLGNTGGVTWASTGSLPAGLSLSTAGLVSGTPTAAAGFSNISFNLTSGTETVSKNVSLGIYAVQITTGGVLPNVTQNVAYSTTIVATGGGGGYTFTANNLPNGLSITPQGVITGTVSSGSGRYGVSITAQAGSASYTKSMSIFVAGGSPAPPEVAPYGGALDDCTIGVPCRLGVSVVGGGTAPFAWSGSGLPWGMEMRTSTGGVSFSGITAGDGELWGTPLASGYFNPILSVTDGADSTGGGSFELHVSELLQSNSLPNGTLGTGYTQPLRVIGGAGPFFGSQTGGQMPGGVELAGSVFDGGALVTGTPIESGSFNPIVSYEDSTGRTLRRTNFFNINGAGSGNLNIYSNGDLGSVSKFSAYSTTLSACCAVGSIVWTKTSGTLPPGVTLSSGGLLSGAPTTAGSYAFLVKAADSNNTANFGARLFTLSVTSSSISLDATTANTGQSVTATIANGPGNALDWVGLYPALASSAISNRLAYQFLNGQGSAPASGLTGATLTFVLPSAGDYQLRFFLNNSLTVLATSATITVIAVPTVTLSATTVTVGQSVTATIANGPGNARDWVGLFATGAPAYLSSAYLSGTLTPPSPGLTGATLTFTLPLTPGTYEVRFFLNNTYTVLATSAPITVAAPPTIALSATTVAPGATVSATIANGPGNPRDWVGLFATGAPAYLSSAYLSGTLTPPSPSLTGATLTFTLPLTPGTYEVRFLLNNTYTVLATSATITVIAVPTVTLSATTGAPGATVSATIANGPGNRMDWVGLFATGAPTYLSSAYLSGTLTPPSPGLTGATLTFTLPLTPGTYEVRFLLNNTYTVLATSSAIAVTAPLVPSIGLSATSVTPGGTVTATIANGPGNARDWVGLFATGAPAYLSSAYLSGTLTPPSPGLTGATLTFTLPLTPGTYEVRFLLNNTYTVLATSAPITVAAPTVTLSATTVAPGATVSATIANGPANPRDWVGLFATGAPTYLSSAYLSGTLTPPSPGLTGATLTFTLPLTPGTYEVRFLLNNTYTVLATSATITVQ